MSSNGRKHQSAVHVPGRETLTRPRAKRFYSEVDLVAADEGGFYVRLDGRTVKTPGKRPLWLPTEPLASVIRAEWSAQDEVIDIETMAMTRLANTVIDAVARAVEAVRSDIVAFAGNDLLCYRASHPRELVACQRARWDPVLEWAERTHGIRLVVVEGVMPVAQPGAALQRVAEVVARYDPFRLASLHVVTTLGGSALLGLALIEGRLSSDEAWMAAHVDEDFQIAAWGEDAEAAERRARRHQEFDAAVRFAALAR